MNRVRRGFMLAVGAAAVAVVLAHRTAEAIALAQPCPSGRCQVPPRPQAYWAVPTPVVYVVPGRSPVLPAPRPIAVPAAQPPTLPPPARAVAPPAIELLPPARATAPEAAPADPLGDALRILNAGRAKIGAPAFVLDARLCKAAQLHSEDMASGRVSMGHSGFPKRITDAGFPFVGTLSEGVFPQAPGVDLQYWCDWLIENPKEAHGRDFADRSHRTIGIGVATGTGGKYPGFYTVEYSDLTAGIVPVGPGTPTPPTPGKPTPPTPGKPTPPVVVVRPSPQGPGSDATSLANAARFYYLDFPLELRGIAGDVASGKVNDLDGLVAAIKAARARASKDMDKQLGEVLAPMLNPDGTIADRAGVAAVIRAIADAMTETQIDVK